MLEGAGEIVTKEQAATNSDGCPAGQTMARVAGEKVGCMTPAPYKLYEAQMRAAYRLPAPVGGYVPNNSYQIRALQQQNLYNQHQQFRIRNGYRFNDQDHLRVCCWIYPRRMDRLGGQP